MKNAYEIFVSRETAENILSDYFSCKMNIPMDVFIAEEIKDEEKVKDTCIGLCDKDGKIHESKCDCENNNHQCHCNINNNDEKPKSSKKFYFLHARKAFIDENSNVFETKYDKELYEDIIKEFTNIATKKFHLKNVTDDFIIDVLNHFIQNEDDITLEFLNSIDCDNFEEQIDVSKVLNYFYDNDIETDYEYDDEEDYDEYEYEETEEDIDLSEKEIVNKIISKATKNSPMNKKNIMKELNKLFSDIENYFNKLDDLNDEDNEDEITF